MVETFQVIPNKAMDSRKLNNDNGMQTVILFDCNDGSFSITRQKVERFCSVVQSYQDWHWCGGIAELDGVQYPVLERST